jgi:ABC-type microcin C transport system duplicated ATPase subunit YejF
MIRYQKQQAKQVEVKKEFIKNKNQMDVSESDLRNRYIDGIFAVPEETLRPINAIKIKEQEEYHYRQHLQTANSKMFKLLAKPEFEENEENL